MSVWTCTSCDCGINYSSNFLAFVEILSEGRGTCQDPSDKNGPGLLELFIFSPPVIFSVEDHIFKCSVRSFPEDRAVSLDINDWRGAGTDPSVFCTVC